MLPYTTDNQLVKLQCAKYHGAYLKNIKLNLIFSEN